MQDKNRDEDTGNEHVDPGGSRGMNWETSTDACAQPRAKETAGENLLHSAGSSAGCSAMASVNGMGWRKEVQQERIYVYM